MFKQIKNFFAIGNTRTIKAKKNIFYSFFIKGSSILVNLINVNLLLTYLKPDMYGAWLTLSSIIAALSFFDIGLTNGLRNRFTEFKAQEFHQKSKIYISTTYVVLILIFSSLWFVFFIINDFLDWNQILNVKAILNEELRILALIFLTFFCLQMILKTINTIIVADQSPAKAASLDLLGQSLSLLFVVFLIENTGTSLIYLGFGVSFFPIIIYVFSTIYFFNTSYKIYSPSFKYVKFEYVKDIFSIGSKFFIIQLSIIIYFQVNNLLISHVGTPSDVAIYNIAYKYMSISLMGFSIIVSPFWSAFTDAFTSNDFKWMKNTLKKLKLIYIYIFIGTIILVFFSNYAYKLWIGNKVIIPFSLTMIIGVYMVFSCWNFLHSQILNGIGKIKIQLILSASTILHIPLGYFLGMKFGIFGVVTSSLFFIGIGAIISTFQLNKIIDGKSKGIWNS